MPTSQIGMIVTIQLMNSTGAILVRSKNSGGRSARNRSRPPIFHSVTGIVTKISPLSRMIHWMVSV